MRLLSAIVIGVSVLTLIACSQPKKGKIAKNVNEAIELFQKGGLGYCGIPGAGDHAHENVTVKVLSPGDMNRFVEAMKKDDHAPERTPLAILFAHQSTTENEDPALGFEYIILSGDGGGYCESVTIGGTTSFNEEFLKRYMP